MASTPRIPTAKPLSAKASNAPWCWVLTSIPFIRSSVSPRPFSDLRNHKVFDIVPGKSERDLVVFLARLQGREKVKVICIDLSNPYRRLIWRWFPSARIVADRFRVVRLIQYHFLALCREVVEELKEKRGIFALLRVKPENLSVRQFLRLEKLFLEHPVLRPIYDQKHRLRALMNQKSKTKRESRPLTH